MNGLRPSYCDAEVVEPYKDVVSNNAISFSNTLLTSSLAKWDMQSNARSLPPR